MKLVQSPATVITVSGESFEPWRERVERLRFRAHEAAGNFRDSTGWGGQLPMAGDDDALHLLAVDRGRLLGAARVHVLERREVSHRFAWARPALDHLGDRRACPVAVLSGKAVAPEAWRRGVGRALDEARLAACERRHVRIACVKHRLSLAASWIRLGFQMAANSTPPPWTVDEAAVVSCRTWPA